MNKLNKLFLFSAAMSLAAGNVSALTIVNGDFENPDITTGSFSIFPSITGWTSTSGGGIEIQDNVAGAPDTSDGGQQFVELDSTSNSSMESDVFTTVAGKLYSLSFLYSDRPGVPADSNGISGEVGSTAFDIAGGLGAATTIWTSYSFTFTGTGSDTISFFAEGDSDSLGGYIDQVTVSAVPEGGATLAMLGSAMCGLALLRFKKR